MLVQPLALRPPAVAASCTPLGAARSSGVHLSGLMAVGLGSQRPAGGNFDAPFAGFMWERLFIDAWRSLLLCDPATYWSEILETTLPTPLIGPEVEMDGVYCTADLVFPGKLVVECKWTQRSERRWTESPVENFMHWLRQGMANCRAHKVNQILYAVWWNGGDYSKKERCGWAHAEGYLLTYSEEEIEANWAELLSRKEMAVPEEWETR